MEQVRIYSRPPPGKEEKEEEVGEEAEEVPSRLDLHKHGEFRLEYVGGEVVHGRVETRDEGQWLVVTHPGKKKGEAFPLVTEEPGVVTVASVRLLQTTAAALSVGFRKAQMAVQTSEQASETGLACEARSGATVANLTLNPPTQPHVTLQPPEVLRRSASEAIRDFRGFPAPSLKVLPVLDDRCGGLQLPHTVTYTELRALCARLRGEGEGLVLLSAAGAFDVKGKSEIPEAEVAKEASRLAAAWGPVVEEEDNEGFERLKAAISPAEYSRPGEAFKILARKALNRTDMLLDALLSNQTLNTLDFSRNALGTDNEGGKSFKQLRKARKVFDDHPALVTLRLAGNGLGPKGAGCILKGITQSTSITALDLSDNGLGGEEEEEVDEDAEADDPAFGEALNGLEAVADLLKKSKFIRKLDLASNRIQGPELTAEEETTDAFGEETSLYKLLLPLRSYHRLTALDLSCNELGPGGAFVVGVAVKSNRSLTSLNLSECSLGTKGLVVLSKHLEERNTLRTLSLRRNQFAGLRGKANAKASARAVAQLSSFLKSASNTLESLDVAYNSLGPDHAASVIGALQGCKTLTTLDFSLNCMCGTATGEYVGPAVEALGQLLRTVPLTSLHLRGNYLQPKGAAVLAAALPEGQVKILDIRQNHVLGEGLRAVCDAGGGLVVLKASSNKAGAEAAEAVAQLIRQGGNLALLDLSDNRLGTQGSRSVLQAVPGSKLQSLNLSKNGIGPDAMPDVAAAAAVLFTLLAGDNDMGADAIGKHLPQCLRGNATLRTIELWGGAGPRSACLKGAIAVLEEGTTSNLISLDLGIPLSQLHDSNTAAEINSCSQQLLDNLKMAEFSSALELAI